LLIINPILVLVDKSEAEKMWAEGNRPVEWENKA